MSDKNSVIADNCVVSFHYTLKDEGGKEIESSRGGEPLTYIHGHSQIVLGLEKVLKGKKVGEHVTTSVSPSEGYGERNEALIITIPREHFQEKAPLKVGAVLELEDDNENVLLAAITEIGKDSVTLDANHPMAGKTLNFAVEIMDIRKATADELAHGHVHKGGCCH
ncbi:MAG: peptidylprolyl isomerase [Oligoflexia bacterium]|nr:peptidylprolyl isomerase [Oligoflexia bacterium]